MKIRLTRALVAAALPRAADYELIDTAVPGLLLRVRKTGARSWVYRPNNRTKRVIGTFPTTTLEMARAAALAMAAEHASGASLPTRRQQGSMLVADFRAERYDAHVLATHRAGKSTIDELDSTWGFLAGYRLADVTPAVIDQWRVRALASGLKPATCNRRVTTLRGMLSRALEWGYLQTHPLARLKQLRNADTHRVRYLTREESGRLLSVLDAWLNAPGTHKQRHIALPMLVLFHTGLRLGELNGLARSDIDLNTGLITVRAATSKAGRVRHVPINAALRAALGPRLAGLPAVRALHVGQPARAWKTLLAEAGIEDLTPHDLRHNFASTLVMGGVDLHTVQSLLGHSTPVMTMRYAHLAPEHRLSAVEVMAKANV